MRSAIDRKRSPSWALRGVTGLFAFVGLAGFAVIMPIGTALVLLDADSSVRAVRLAEHVFIWGPLAVALVAAIVAVRWTFKGKLASVMCLVFAMFIGWGTAVIWVSGHLEGKYPIHPSTSFVTGDT
ncbi:MAG: hypothetical protein ACJA0Y_000871 [Maricaulis maris]|jgi:hypothetical protein